MQNFKNLNDFKLKLQEDENLQKAFKEDPLKAIDHIAETPSIPNDVWIYRIVVLALGLAVLTVVIGLILLILNSKPTNEISTIFTAIASGAIGALAGLLAPSPKSNQA